NVRRDPVLASRTTIELVYRFAPGRYAPEKSGPGLPAGTYRAPASASNVRLVQTEPPPTWTPFGHVSAPGASPVGTSGNVHTTRPLAASRPATMQPQARPAPEVPMKTIPFHAVGEAAIVAVPPSLSLIWVVQISSPVLMS